MIALDAAVLIALFDANDAHHAAAANTALIRADTARENRDQEMSADLRALGIETTPLPDDAATRLARLRAHTRAKMPDCCVLLTAEQTSARIATFDEGLKMAARSLGLGVV